MSGSGKGGNRKHHQRFSGWKSESQKQVKINNDNSYSKVNAQTQDRPRWSAPVLPANPITTPACRWCGKPITDITSAISDKETGLPVHFDCVLKSISESEKLEANDTICYIGGGRFGIVHYNNPPDIKDFTIKKILEWEIKDQVSEWRRPISEYFSIT